MMSKELLVEYYEREKDTLVKRYARRMQGWHNAEDVVQDAFLRAYVYIGSFDADRTEIGAWFNTILNNTAKDYQRIERMQGGTRVEEEFSDDLEEIALRRECIEQIMADVDAMPDPSREVIRRFVFLGDSAKHISRSLGVNINTARKYIQDFYNDTRQRYGQGEAS
jgi:RNA polymerase sigma factor (sigma-70 family)